MLVIHAVTAWPTSAASLAGRARDHATETLVGVVNRILAGKVPDAVAPLLTAGRGLTIPKDDKGNLRPIVVGHVLLRFVSSLALSLSREACDEYFLGGGAAAKQFGVGVASGCNLMAMTVDQYLRNHPGHIAISCDTKNAFHALEHRSRALPPP